MLDASSSSLRRDNPEERLHRTVAHFLRIALKDEECLWWHCPSGEKRGKAAAGKLKAMGTRPGVPDICLILPDGKAGFIELKAKDGSLSPEQRRFRDQATAQGARWALCRSVDEVDCILGEWGVRRHAFLKGHVALQSPADLGAVTISGGRGCASPVRVPSLPHRPPEPPRQGGRRRIKWTTRTKGMERLS
jgi:hypothetical protein